MNDSGRYLSGRYVREMDILCGNVPHLNGAARSASSRHLACILGCFARKYTAQERDFAVVSEPARNRLVEQRVVCPQLIFNKRCPSQEEGVCMRLKDARPDQYYRNR